MSAPQTWDSLCTFLRARTADSAGETLRYKAFLRAFSGWCAATGRPVQHAAEVAAALDRAGYPLTVSRTGDLMTSGLHIRTIPRDQLTATAP